MKRDLEFLLAMHDEGCTNFSPELIASAKAEFLAMRSALEHLAKYGKNCDVVFIAKQGLKGGTQ